MEEEKKAQAADNQQQQQKKEKDNKQQEKKGKLDEDLGKKDQGKKLTPEEKKAQREAVNAAKAAKKAEAAAKKAAKLAEELADDGEEKEIKPKKEKKQNADPSAQQAKQEAAPAVEVEQKTEMQNDLKAALGASGLAGQKVQNTGKQNRKMSILENPFAQQAVSNMSNNQKQEATRGVSAPVGNIHQQHSFDMNKSTNPSKLVQYLYHQDTKGLDEMHPSIHDVGLKLVTDKFEGTNQTTVAILLAMKEVIREFQQTNKKIVYHQELLQVIRDRIIPFLERCKRLFAGTDYALKEVRREIGQISKTCKNLLELKERVIEKIDEFIVERIIFAQDELIRNGMSIMSSKQEEVILLYGSQETQTIENLLKKAHQSGKQFRCIVADSAPDFLGRSLVKRLAQSGIKCQYTLISMLNFLIKGVTKVFLASTYVLCNGALVAPIGSSMIGCLAHKNQIPVVAICETYKFDDRVNLDQINNNEQGMPDKFKNNYLRKSGLNNNSVLEQKRKKGEKGPSPSEMELINLRYDLTPQKYLSMIVCDVGNIPPHSVPVVIKEMAKQIEDDDHDDSDNKSDSSLESDKDSGVVEEQDDEDGSDEEFTIVRDKKDSAQRKRMQQMKDKQKSMM